MGLPLHGDGPYAPSAARLYAVGLRRQSAGCRTDYFHPCQSDDHTVHNPAGSSAGRSCRCSRCHVLPASAVQEDALGMYMADYNVLKAIGKPTAEVEGVIAKLATDLNVSFVLDILKEQAPKDATKEQLQAFLNAQEDKIIEKMAAENKVDAEVEMLGAASAEYACLVANPTLVVEGDATSAGLSTNMEKRVSMLEEVVADLAAYYPDLKQLGETIAPLKEKVASIQSARAANAEIMGIRDALLK